MALINVKCNSCGGEVKLDDSRKEGYCLYCGSKLLLQDYIKIDKSDDEQNYLFLAREADKVDNFKECEKYSNLVLEINHKNPEAWFYKGISLLLSSTYKNNRLDEAYNYILNSLDFAEKEYGKDSDEYNDFVETIINNIYYASNTIPNRFIIDFREDKLEEISNIIEKFINFGYEIETNTNDKTSYDESRVVLSIVDNELNTLITRFKNNGINNDFDVHLARKIYLKYVLLLGISNSYKVVNI